MRSRWRLLLGIISVGVCQAAEVDFVRDVQPLFVQHCQMCHGAQQQMSGLRLDRPDGILRVVQPGSSAGSKLVERVSSTKPGFFMPPVGARLKPTEIETIRAWIDGGAKMPA